MPGPATILIAIILVATALISVLISKPSITITRGGKVLAFVAIFILPLFAGSMGLNEHMQRSKNTEFCTSCHVMTDYGRSLFVDDPTPVPAAHFQNNRVPRGQACYTCHADYAMFGGMKAKLRGLRHVYVQYFGRIPDKIELYKPYNNRECLQCHGGARSFEEGATHSMETGRVEMIKSGQLSCLSTGCHDTGHDIGNLGDKALWTPSPAATHSTDSESSQLDREEK